MHKKLMRHRTYAVGIILIAKVKTHSDAGLDLETNEIISPKWDRVTHHQGGASMNRAGWNPFRELEEMSDRLNRVVARVPRGSNDNEAMTMADWIPSVDISETTAEYVIEAEIPEVKKEDVRVTLENGVLTVRGMRRQEPEEKGRKYHRVERSYGSFVRSFSLPDEVNDAQVQAVFKDGILTLHLPKSEKAKPKALEVKVA